MDMYNDDNRVNSLLNVFSNDNKPSDNKSEGFGVFDKQKDNLDDKKKKTINAVVSKLSSKPGDYSAPIEGDPTEFEKYNILVNPIDKDLEKQRAKNQSAFEQFGRSLAQGLGGEVVGGTIAGFGSILDVVTGAAFKEDNDYSNPLTDLGEGIREGIREELPIYQEDPNAALDFSDTGYIFNRLPSVLSSISLLIPGKAASWALGKAAGKVAGLARTTRVGKAIEEAAKAGDYGKSIQAATSAYNINRIKSYAETAVTAGGMRIGENYQEARQTTQQVKSETLAQFNSMNDDEYSKWASETGDKLGDVDFNDKEAVATRIASKAAGRDFAINLSNFAMDFIQLRALSGAWANMARRPASSTLISANQNAAATLGRTADEIVAMSKKTAFTKGKDILKRSILAGGLTTYAQLSEGLEESVNYIAGQEGLLYGRILNGMIDEGDTDKINEARNYLKDPMLYDSALWGVIGGVVFQGLGNATSRISNKIMGREDVNEKQRLAEIEGRNSIWTQAQTNIDKINQGVNPYEIEENEDGTPILENGVIKYKLINNENERDFLRNKTDRDVITTLSLNAIRTGNYNLLKDYINEPSIKERLIAGEFSTKEDYDAYSIKINNIADEVMEKFSSNSKLLRNSAIDDNYLNIAISENIYNENTISDIEERISRIQSSNSDIASSTPNIEELRNTSNLDNRFKIGILQQQMVEINKEISTLEAKQNRTIQEDSYLKDLIRHKNAAKVSLDAYKLNLSPLEAFKAKMQEDVFNGVAADEIQKDLDAFKAANPNEDFGAANQMFSLNAINEFARNINKEYVDNLYDELTYEIEKNKLQKTLINTQQEAEAFAANKKLEFEKAKERIINKSKADIQNILNTDERDAAYAYLNGNDNAAVSDKTKKILDAASSILITSNNKDYKKELDIEYDKAKKLNPISPVEELPLPETLGENRDTNIIPPAITNNQIVPPVNISTEIIQDTLADKEAINIIDEISNTIVSEFTDAEILSSNFVVIKPFTYKNNKYENIEIIPGRRSIGIIAVDSSGIEESLDNKQLSYLVANGFISSSTGELQNESDDTTELRSIDIEGITAIRKQFDNNVNLIRAYARATNRNPNANGVTGISFDELMRYVISKKGTETANNLYDGLRSTLEYLANIDGSIIITDNKQLLNKTKTDLLNTVSKSKIELIKESNKKDNSPTILQMYVPNRTSLRNIKTPEMQARYNAIMTLKDGDAVTAKVNKDGLIEVYNGDYMIGTLPSIKVDIFGRYEAINEFWEYQISLSGTNYNEGLTSTLKAMLRSNKQEDVEFLSKLEDLRIAINTNLDVDNALFELESNASYKLLVNSYGVKGLNKEEKLKRANHILKLFSYNNNVTITDRFMYPTIAKSLDSWINKLGNNYSNLSSFKNNLNSNNQLVINNVTSGVLIKENRYNSIGSVIRQEDSDNHKLYYYTAAGDLVGEGNPNDILDTASSKYPKGAPIMFVKDSNGRRVPAHVFVNSFTGKYEATSKTSNHINRVMYDTIYNGLESLLNGDIASFKNLLAIINNYSGSGKVMKGIYTVPTKYGHAINFENGYTLMVNYINGDISIAPFKDNRPITYTTKDGKEISVRWYAPSERNTRYTTAMTLNNIKKLKDFEKDGISINYNKDSILNNGAPNMQLDRNDIVKTNAVGEYIITLPNGEEIVSKDYKTFLLDNNLLTTNVGAVRNIEGNVIGNFDETGEGFGADKNIYLTLKPKETVVEKEIKKRERKKIEKTIEQQQIEAAKAVIRNKGSLKEVSQALGINKYDDILDVFEKLGVTLSPTISTNNKEENANTNASINIKTNKITTYHKLFTYDNDRIVRILVHEGLHGYLNQLDNYEELTNRFKNVYNVYSVAVSNEQDAGRKANMAMFLEGANEKIKLEEFIVKALTNKDLITYLNEIESNVIVEKGTNKSLFRKLLDLMVELVSNVKNISDNTLLAEINNIFNEFGDKNSLVESNIELASPVESNINSVTELEILDDMSIFDDIDINEFDSSDIELNAQRTFGSVNSLVNRLTVYEKAQFDRLLAAGEVNIMCN